MIKPQHLISSSENFKLNKINGIRIERLSFVNVADAWLINGPFDPRNTPIPFEVGPTDPGGGTTQTEFCSIFVAFTSIRIITVGKSYTTTKGVTSFIGASHDIVPVASCGDFTRPDTNYNPFKIPFNAYPCLYHYMTNPTTGTITFSEYLYGVNATVGYFYSPNYNFLTDIDGYPDPIYSPLPNEGDILYPGLISIPWNLTWGVSAQINSKNHEIQIYSSVAPTFTCPDPSPGSQFEKGTTSPLLGYYIVVNNEFDITGLRSNFWTNASTENNSIYHPTSNPNGILRYTITIVNGSQTTTLNNITTLGTQHLMAGVNVITWTIDNIDDYAWTGSYIKDPIDPTDTTKWVKIIPTASCSYTVNVTNTNWILECSESSKNTTLGTPLKLIQNDTTYTISGADYDAGFVGYIPTPPIVTHNITPILPQTNTSLDGFVFATGDNIVTWKTTFTNPYAPYDNINLSVDCTIRVEDDTSPTFSDCDLQQTTVYKTVGFTPIYEILSDEFDRHIGLNFGSPILTCTIDKNGTIYDLGEITTLDGKTLDVGKNVITWTITKTTNAKSTCTITVYVGQILGKNGGDAISTICLGATNIEYRVDGGPGVTNYTWNLEYAVGAYISNSFTTSSNPIKLNFPIMLSPGSYIEVSYVFGTQIVKLNFYISTVASDGSGYQLLYYDNQTLSIETQRLNTNEFDLDKYIESEFDYFDYFFRNTRYINDEGDYVQTTHYSIFNNGDDYTPSSTVFKGIKYNAHKLKGLIRNESSKFIEQYLIDNSENYNGYKFSVILNTKYDRLTESLNKIYGQSTQITTGSTTPSQSVISTTLNDNAANGKQWSSTNSLHVFVNDKYKNILVIIDMSFNLKNGYSLTLNNVSHFDQREGLYLNYENTTFDYGYLNYDSDVLIANNYISSINNLNDPNLFEDYISFYYIDSIGDFGYSKINGVNINSNDFASIPSWNNNFPPIRLECELPNSIDTKKKSFNIAAIKGPKFNIYDKFKTDFKENVYDKSFIKEPLSRYITINEYESKQTKTYTKELEYNNTIFRYNGPYEPIFKTVELFAPTYYSVVNSSIFSQNKSGGFLAANVNSSSELQLSLSELNQEEIKLSNTVDYINNKFIDIYDDITYANIINDNIVKVKLNNDLVFYNNLMLSTQSAYTSTLSSITFLTQYLTNNVSPTGATNWIFKDKILGLCDGNNTTCEININSPSVFYKNSEELNINNFGFNIPLDSTITGIKISIKKFAKNGYRQSPLATYTTVVDNNIYLIKPNGIDKSNNIALKPSLLINLSSPLNTDEQYFWPTASTLYEYGGVDDLFGFTGNTILTPQEINNKNFGLSLSVTGYKLNNTTYVNIANIDCVSITVYYTVNSLEIGKIYTSSIDRNTKFDTDLCHFGEISELIYSKVNEKESPLKIQGTEEDRSIYPMIDEFGYTWDRRFIFKSSWDADYYRRTKNEIE